MNEKNMKPGDKTTYFDKEYVVEENKITVDKNKSKILLTINLLSVFITAAFFIIYIIIINLIGPAQNMVSFSFLKLLFYMVFFFAAFAIFIAAHEYVHYLAYRVFGKVKKQNFKFGLVLKSGMAYCISLQPSTVKVSRISLMMPLYVLVIPLFIISVVLKNNFIAFLTAMFAGGSAGDLWYIWTLRKYPKDKYIIESVPSSSGYEIGYLVMDLVNQ